MKDRVNALTLKMNTAAIALAILLAGLPASTVWAETGIVAEIETEIATDLPSRYDVRDVGKTPVIRSQGDSEDCWALTALSALEAIRMPQESGVYSEDHMVLENAFTVEAELGGDYRMIMAYLSGWQGPVVEEDTKDPALHVQEIRLLTGEDRETFEQMILRSGPVQTSLYMNRSLTSDAETFYNKKEAAYLCDQRHAPDHDVLILGWDDSYSRENFLREPEEDGAWICQNSWGEDFGDHGIFYVSYADANITRSGLAYTGVEDADNYTGIYQTDPCGWQAKQGYEDDTCWLANVYTADRDESAAAVGFYATGEDTSYEVYLVEDYESTDSFADRELLASGRLEQAGYYTVKLDQPIPLRQGERFAAVVRVTTPGATKPAAVEVKKNAYTQNVTTEGKEGYLSRTGSLWEHTEQKFGTNVCLKVYTEENDG